jgi:GxxExxY protein
MRPRNSRRSSITWNPEPSGCFESRVNESADGRTQPNSSGSGKSNVEHCPSCKARLKGAAVCPRCGADLDLLVGAKAQVKTWICDALLGWKSGERDKAVETIRKIRQVDSSPATKRIAEFLEERLRRPVVRCVDGQNILPRENEIRQNIIDCAIEVFRELGGGLALSAYDDCLSREMALRNLNFERNHPVPVRYKGLRLAAGGRINHLVEGTIAVSLCAKRSEIDRFERSFSNWLRLGGWPGGLLIDFDAG